MESIYLPTNTKYERSCLRRIANPLVAVLLLVICGSETVAQTSIVAYWSSSQIIIGTDSREIVIKTDGKYETAGVITRCKITQIGDTFFAFAGTRESTKTGYFATSLAIKAARAPATTTQTANRFANLIKPRLQLVLQNEKQDDPGSFAKYTTKDRVASAALFAGVERGQLKLVSMDFILTLTDSGAIGVTSEQTICPGCGNEGRMFALGEKAAIRAFVAQKQSFGDIDPITAVRKLIELEVADAPDTVSAPIDIIRITRDGAQWIQRKKECPDIQNLPKPAPKPTKPGRKRP